MVNAFGMNNYGIPIIGTMRDIENTTKKDLQNWYKSYYQPNNAVVIIAGNFDKDKVKRYIKKYYGSIKNQKHGIPIAPSVEFETKEFFEVYEDVSKPVIFLSFSAMFSNVL